MNIVNLIIDFFAELFLPGGSYSEKKILLRYTNLLMKSSPRILEGKNKYITPQFCFFLHTLLKPTMYLIPSLREDFQNKDGKAFQRYLVMQQVDELLLAKLMQFDSEDSVLELSRKNNSNYEEMLKLLDKVTNDFHNALKPEVQQSIQDCLDTMYKFSQLREFDYMSFFKEFSPSYAPNKPIKVLSFRAGEATPFAIDFEIINNFINSLEPNTNTLRHIITYSQYIQKDTSKEGLNLMLKHMQVLKNNSYLDKLIQVLAPDKKTYMTPFKQYEANVEDEITKFVASAKKSIEGCYNKKKDSQAKQLVQRLFPDGGLLPLQNYSNEKNSVLIGSGINKTFKYIAEIELVYAFVATKYADDIKEMFNNLIIKGNFNNEETKKLVNDTFFNLSELINTVLEFDKNLGQDGDEGARIWRALSGVQSSKKINPLGGVSELIEKVNDKARALINTVVLNLKRLYNILDVLIKTSKLNSKTFLTNINDFNGSKTPFLIQNQYTQALESVTIFFQLLKLKSKSVSSAIPTPDKQNIQN